VSRNGTHTVNCASLTECHDRKRWPTNGHTCHTCDCACKSSATSSHGAITFTIAGCSDPNKSGGSCPTSRHEDLLAAEQKRAIDDDDDEDDESSSDVAPTPAPPSAPIPTPPPAVDDDDDESSDATVKPRSHHKHHSSTCRNGRREHGEECDGPLDDGWFTVCNDDCEFETFWPSAFAVFIIFVIVVLFLIWCCTRCVHRHVVAVPCRTRRTVLVCNLHNRPNCAECGNTTVTVIRNAPRPPAGSPPQQPPQEPTQTMPVQAKPVGLISGFMSSAASASSSSSTSDKRKTK
jgi:hypothetical protein